MTRLYLPITSQPRELDSKLLLGLVACERGFDCLLGFKGAFRGEVSVLEPGYFLAHNARQNPDHFRLLSIFGNRVWVLDEEALIRQSDEIFLKKHRQGAFNAVEHLLCWGENDEEMWSHHRDFAPCPIDVVGNPRIDLLRPECNKLFRAQADAYVKKYGDYILLNTNFPSVNNITPQGEGVRLAAWALDERGREIENAFLSNKRATFEAMQALIRPLAMAIAPLKLIVRPHPNERHDLWHEIANELDNVEVVFEGGVIPWLLGAIALIHNNCTTGVESAVIGTPVLNYRPWTNEDYDNPLVHAFGTDCKTAEELAGCIKTIMREGPTGLTKAQEDKLRHHIISYDGRLACDRIIDLIEKDYAGAPRFTKRGRFLKRLSIHIRNRRLWLERYLGLWLTTSGREKRKFLKHTFPSLSLLSLDFPTLGGTLSQLALHVRQFPPVDVERWQARVDELAAATGRFKGIVVRLRPDGLVALHRR